MGNTIGLFTLAALVAVFSFLVPKSEVAKELWGFTYVIWAACAIFIWHHRKAPTIPRKWLLLALYSVISASLWFGIARVASWLYFRGAEPTLSKFFDIYLTLMVSPGITFIAISGGMRSLLLNRKRTNL